MKFEEIEEIIAIRAGYIYKVSVCTWPLGEQTDAEIQAYLSFAFWRQTGITLLGCFIAASDLFPKFQ
jgi:hypothetical protein